MRLGQRPIEADVRTLRVLLGKVGLAQPGGWLPFVTYDVLLGSGIAANGNPFAVTVSRAFTVRTWHQWVYVATTNDGSNYWTIDLKRSSDNAVISTLNTSAISPDTKTVLSNAGIAAAISTSHLALYISVTKTGSPGAVYLYGPAVFVT
jgi:hypothetical protein